MDGYINQAIEKINKDILSGKIEEAEKEALLLYKDNDKNILLLNMLGNIYNKKSDSHSSIKYLEEANKLSNGKDGYVLFNLGVSYSNIDKNKSKEYLNQAKNIIPNDDNLLNFINNFRYNIDGELGEVIYSNEEKINKTVLLINIEPSDVSYNNFLRNCFCSLFNNEFISNDIISYENKSDLQINLGNFYKSNENIYGDTYFFSSILTDQVFELLVKLIELNNYKKIIFHGRGYFLYKLLTSTIFDNIKNKLIIYSSHLLDLETDLKNTNILDIKDFNTKIKSVLNYYSSELYTFPEYFIYSKNISLFKNQYDSKFKIFVGGKSNRDINKIKYFINKLNSVDSDFEFFITSDYDFSDCKNCIVHKYLQFKDFMEILGNCNLNLILNKDITKNSGDTTLMLGYFYGVPGITNTINKYSLQYIKDNYTGFLINNDNFDEVIDKISIIKDNYNIRKELNENTKKFFLDNFTTERLVKKIYNN